MPGNEHCIFSGVDDLKAVLVGVKSSNFNFYKLSIYFEQAKDSC